MRVHINNSCTFLCACILCIFTTGESVIYTHASPRTHPNKHTTLHNKPITSFNYFKKSDRTDTSTKKIKLYKLQAIKKNVNKPTAVSSFSPTRCKQTAIPHKYLHVNIRYWWILSHDLSRNWAVKIALVNLWFQVNTALLVPGSLVLLLIWEGTQINITAAVL